MDQRVEDTDFDCIQHVEVQDFPHASVVQIEHPLTSIVCVVYVCERMANVLAPRHPPVAVRS